MILKSLYSPSFLFHKWQYGVQGSVGHHQEMSRHLHSNRSLTTNSKSFSSLASLISVNGMTHPFFTPYCHFQFFLLPFLIFPYIRNDSYTSKGIQSWKEFWWSYGKTIFIPQLRKTDAQKRKRRPNWRWGRTEMEMQDSVLSLIAHYRLLSQHFCCLHHGSGHIMFTHYCSKDLQITNPMYITTKIKSLFCISPKTTSRTTFWETLNQQMSKISRMTVFGLKKNFQTIRMLWNLGRKFPVTSNMEVKNGQSLLRVL